MSSAPKAIYYKLSTTQDLIDLVGEDVYPYDREDVIPAVVYGCSLREEHRDYESVIAGEYEVTIACVARSLAAADEISATVATTLDDQDWTVGSEIEVIGCWIEDKDHYESELSTPNEPIWVVELKAKLLVQGGF